MSESGLADRRNQSIVGARPSFVAGNMEARRVAVAVGNYGVKVGRPRLVMIGGTHLALARSQQLSADELIEVAVEHALSIANLNIGAVIFDHRVRMEHI